MAICDDCGVVAVANGSIVDLFLASGLVLMSGGNAHSDDDDNQGADDAEGDRGGRCHPPFLTQIALDEYKDIQGYAQKADHKEVTSVMLATCVCFVAPGVLLIGATKSQDAHGDGDGISTWIFGFRIYVSSVALQRVSKSPFESSRSRPDPAMAHFSFLEQILLPNANGIACIEMCQHCTNLQAGAVVLLLKESSSFAIFQWRERFSDRQVCVAELPGCTAPLVATSLNFNGQWGAISDSRGHLYLLDFGFFEWYGHSSSRRGGDIFPSLSESKRLKIGSCSRSGILLRDNPLESVRLASVTGGMSCVVCVACCYRLILWLWTLNPSGHERQSVFTSLRWWKAASASEGDQFLIAGSLGGTVSIYPAISALREDPVRQIYIRKNQVLSISNTAGRFWELQSTSSSDESNCVVWPTIKEFWESPAIHFTVQPEIEGVCAVSPSGKLGTALSATLFAREAENENSEHWIVALVTGQSLQFISRQALSEAAKVSCINSRAGEQTESNEMIPPADVSGIDELETSPQQIDHRDEKRAHDKTSVATTIQEKYRLPHTTWDVNLRAAPEKESGEPRAETARTGFDEVNIAQLTKVTPAAYDQRVVETARRIEQLSSTLKQLRTSFQLFTQDAQQHMNAMTEQLEEAVRLRLIQGQQNGNGSTFVMP
ncbi:hypothetical protein FI667_g13840, partial [Globisporangium splendens]